MKVLNRIIILGISAVPSLVLHIFFHLIIFFIIGFMIWPINFGAISSLVKQYVYLTPGSCGHYSFELAWSLIHVQMNRLKQYWNTTLV